MAPEVSVNTTVLSPTAERSARRGVILTLCLALPPAFAAVGFAARVPLTPVPLLVVAVALAVWCRRDDPGEARRTLAITAGVLALSIGPSTAWFDLSYDGQTYHQLGIRMLAEGWNPVWDPGRESVTGGTHVTGLPKGAWTFAAMLMQLTGNIESGKAMHYIALAAAYLLTWPALTALGVGVRRARVVAALAAANPVALQQLNTYYVDGVVASALLTLVALLVLLVRTHRRRWAVAAAAQCGWLVTLKFTGAAMAVECMLLVVVWIAWRDRARLAAALRMASMAGVVSVIVGINPYVTNTVRHGHPGYPAAGRDALPWASWVYSDSAFRESPRPVQLARSIFSASSDKTDASPRLKIPLAVSVAEVGSFTSVDTRIAGWGPWFGAALLLSWSLVALAWRRGDSSVPLIAAASLLPVLSALALPFGAYARYAPHVWIAALPALLLARPHRVIAAFAGILTVNVAFVGGVSQTTSVIDQVLHRRQLATLARDAAGGVVTVSQAGPPFVNVDLHLDAYGVRYENVSAPTCPAPALLLRTHALLCLPGGRSPAQTSDPLDVIRPWLPRWITLPDPAGAR